MRTTTLRSRGAGMSRVRSKVTLESSRTKAGPGGRAAAAMLISGMGSMMLKVTLLASPSW